MSDLSAHLVGAIEAALIDGSWLALYTADDTEASFTGYARQELAVASGANTGAVTVTNGGDSPVTLTHAALWDAETSGDALTAAVALGDPVELAPGDSIEFDVGAVTFTA